ncbi:MBOAT family protein [Campylobacter sp. faydin G-24]|uniref:MBOAT family protein n=1 Tax=Campylobacter anatolicus TaxID=2829105 RepID=A0ABS5HFW8_9BACT|nr:MBOAT family O-acyltransferase [Campylobacter anatolicus]MBR8463169.1 MBOAT family protein [Campylobacter anatolicus]
MLFNSYEFIFLFLPFVFFIYFYLNYKRLTVVAKVFLVFSSLFFYGYWNVAYLPILLISIIFNYFLSISFDKVKKYKKLLLIFGIVFNISLLGYFKYYDFFISNFNAVFNTNINLLHLTLPLALSFVTFQQIAYLVDSYHKYTKEKNFLNYTLFISFFPQLIAGPIVHHKEMMSQFASKFNMVKNYKNIAVGIFIFSIGLFKKVIIADNFAIWASAGFDTATSLSFFEAWATSLSYTFQLYFDFSGYCDMATGIALMFNIKLPINFNSPYKALNIQDFWRRWHMTLSRFLRDYIYIPLGGNKGGAERTYANLLIVFLIGGLWHGAGWTFVFWGFLHGIALIVYRIWNSLGFKLHKILAWVITFNFVNVTWVFFRAKEWDDAIKVIKGMIGINGVIFPQVLAKKLSFLQEFGVQFGPLIVAHKITITYILISLFVIWFKNSQYLAINIKFTNKQLLFSCLLFLISALSMNKISEFLYFNF